MSNTPETKPGSTELMPIKKEDGALTMGFSNAASFELLQRAAKMFAQTTIVPAAYQAVIQKGYGDKATYEQNPAALGNCAVALDMSTRMNMSPVMVMQNLNVIEGKPSWSAQFIIACINESGRFSPLRFKMTDLGEMDAEYSTYEWEETPSGKSRKVEKKHKVRIRNKECIAWAIEKATGERLESAPVSIAMAVSEGWYGKNGSKWRSMPDLMLQYRSGAFFGRIYAPELMMGLPTADEVLDIIDVAPNAAGVHEMVEDKPAGEKQPEDFGVRSKSEKATRSKKTEQAKQAEDPPEEQGPRDSDQAPQGTAGDVVDASFDEKPATASTAQEQQAQPEKDPRQMDILEAGGDDDRPLTEQEYDFLMTKMEVNAIGSADVLAKFGIKLADLTYANYHTVLNWVKNPV